MDRTSARARALPLPPRRWGVTVPLIALWQGAQAGMGTDQQLGQLAEGLARKGAAFLGINLIHWGFPTDILAASPYAPHIVGGWNTPHGPLNGARLPETGALIELSAHDPRLQRAALEEAFCRVQGVIRASILASGGSPAAPRWKNSPPIRPSARCCGGYWGALPFCRSCKDPKSAHKFKACS